MISLPPRPYLAASLPLSCRFLPRGVLRLQVAAAHAATEEADRRCRETGQARVQAEQLAAEAAQRATAAAREAAGMRHELSAAKQRASAAEQARDASDATCRACHADVAALRAQVHALHASEASLRSDLEEARALTAEREGHHARREAEMRRVRARALAMIQVRVSPPWPPLTCPLQTCLPLTCPLLPWPPLACRLAPLLGQAMRDATNSLSAHSHAHQLDLIEKLAKGEGTMTSTDVGDFLELAQHVVLQHEGMDTDFPIYLSQVATIPRAISHIPR